MRFNTNPPKVFFRLLSITAQSNNTELIYITPKSINISKGVINGKMLINDQIVDIEREIPQFIDISPYFFNKRNKKKYQKELHFLQKNSELSINEKGIINKDELQKVLSSSKIFKNFSIPTNDLKNYNDLINQIENSGKLIVKPVTGAQGRGVIAIEKVKDQYFVYEQKKQNHLSYTELKNYYKEHIENKHYITQKFITSVSKDNNPIDCRVHLEKDGNGQWQLAGQFIRIGIGQTVVSNIRYGGCITEVKGYLQSNFGEGWKEVYEKIIKVGRTLPYMLEEYKEKEYTTMGFDIGINKNGDLCIFEVNSYPIVTPQRSKVAKIRGEHYAYRIKRKMYGKKLYLNSKKIQYKLEKENELLRKEINKIKASTSWKLSQPIRVFGKIFKNN